MCISFPEVRLDQRCDLAVIPEIAVAGRLVFAVPAIVGDDFFEAPLRLPVVLQVEKALGDDVDEAIGIENDAFFQESRRVVDNGQIEAFRLLRGDSPRGSACARCR
jgi:hypothetical protein